MDLWRGSLLQFLSAADAGALPAAMLGGFYNAHGAQPSSSELRSWENSLPALARAIRPLRGVDLGIAVSTSESPALALDRSRPAGIALEYHLPLSGKRVDVVLTGRDRRGGATAVVVELKQWSDAGLEDEHATNVLVGGHEHVHPSQQARDYADWLTDYHSAFTAGDLVAAPLAFCHEMPLQAATALRDARFDDLLVQAPLFVHGEEGALVEHLALHVGAGDGLQLLDRLTGSRFQPSARVLDNLEAVLNAEDEWHLLDEQRLAFNAILDEVKRQQARAGQSAIIVRGAPGTGKTVIAVQLLAAALRLKWKAAHSTGGKAFTTALRSRFKGADQLFIWNMNTRNAAPAALDLLLVDEAHRIRESSDTRHTPTAQRGKRSQLDELLAASRVAVFFVDDNQSVRPDEVGSSAMIREHLKSKRARFKEFELASQFRCGGCVEYIAWVDWLLGFAEPRPEPWGECYQVELAGSPAELDSLVSETRDRGQTARLLAGFCWKWSDPAADGSLVDDVVIDEWRRPWNRKASDKKTYKPADHPYTRWAQTAEGESQVGCIYSAQGFEFSRAGVIWGNDLVWRSGAWVAQPKESQDRPVKASTEMLTLVRNAYRVLLTRGLQGVRILVVDPETREHIAAALRRVKAPES